MDSSYTKIVEIIGFLSKENPQFASCKLRVRIFFEIYYVLNYMMEGLYTCKISPHQ